MRGLNPALCTPNTQEENEKQGFLKHSQSYIQVPHHSIAIKRESCEEISLLLKSSSHPCHDSSNVSTEGTSDATMT